ncbi:MAG: hypothetical protein A2X34_08030 [Elusimicrobia bacterium GWC2_51_8]|nr:MAG: hypothetical protein A2X33_03350 [Elusimicrobia bacterium GWA2_51_34]OGR65200.1 MAG: hypothetical protein A2X34_08030 [Elusimicrobia bacterium GWC2_51_8]OGR86036.1 MAG: hypothetical protein A2021_09860 [Elusimicrobia bacterium GWF2_52_66]HAF95621.1 hypothetical protein [Elusimicrobiota bacterium]HCE98311.1 hypothetical protein [Elusimicrobiota bacterium]
MPGLLDILLAFSGLSSAVQFYFAVSSARRTKFLEDYKPPPDFKFPSLSIITPARDEADTVLEASLSKLACEYPGFELILADDRSVDGTGGIIDSLALKDKRVKAIHIKTLPENWLGKVNALQEGLKAASGEWLLFSDADVVFAPDTLKKAVFYAETNCLGHLALMPELVPGGFAMDAIFNAGVLPMARWASWNSETAGPAQAVGIGAFNLVKRSEFLKTPGFEWLKLEIIDDMGLALMMRLSGAKGASLSGRGLLKLRLYKTLAEAARGAGKSALSAAEFNLALSGLAVALLLISEVLPFLLWFYPGAPIAAVFAVCALKLSFYSYFSARNRRPVLPALLAPFGAAVGILVMFKYAASNAMSGNVSWRGTSYPVSLLKVHKRFHLENFY